MNVSGNNVNLTVLLNTGRELSIIVPSGAAENFVGHWDRVLSNNMVEPKVRKLKGDLLSSDGESSFQCEFFIDLRNVIGVVRQ